VLDDRAHDSADPMNPELVAHELSPRIPDRAILTADSGSGTNWWARHLRLRKGMRASLSGTLAMADLFYLPLAAHDTGSVICNIATVHWAASVRDFLAAETLIGSGNWMDDVILHDGPIVTEWHITVPVKPALGIDLNKDVVKANLARGEKYWD